MKVTEQELREMELHERRKLNDLQMAIVEICRVPGGWIYQYYNDPRHRVFIPEFYPSRHRSVRVFKDGNMWCCLLGKNLQEGLTGFGSTPDEACRILMISGTRDE